MKDTNVVASMLLEEKKEKIANAIQTARIKKGLTQEQLGDIVSLSRNSIVRIENKRFFPSMENFLLILDCLDLTLKIGDGEI
jgi:DNA-binding XRE family transcriptional regulator